MKNLWVRVGIEKWSFNCQQVQTQLASQCTHWARGHAEIIGVASRNRRSRTRCVHLRMEQQNAGPDGAEERSVAGGG
jgi:hypothetical protein